MGRTDRIRLRIVGVYAEDDAYPNVKFRLQDLRGSSRFEVQEVHQPLRGAQRSFLRQSSLAYVLLLLRLGWRHARVLAAWFCSPRADADYLPYPAILIAWLLSFVPRAYRSPLIIDAFISWYDTAVHDRALFTAGSLVARLLWRVERRAYAAADVVVVDTQANVAQMSAQFQLPLSKFAALRLAIDEEVFAPLPYQSKRAQTTVLFIGTFVPLQGVEVIAEAIVALANEPEIKMRVIGTGQMASQFEAIVSDAGSDAVDWVQQWQDSQALRQAIAEADICLGVFGSGAKTERVWPFKNYLYMCGGRTLITGDTEEARALLETSPNPAFHVVPCGDSQALTAKIRALSADQVERERCATAARQAFIETLSRKRSSAYLEGLIEEAIAYRAADR